MSLINASAGRSFYQSVTETVQKRFFVRDEDILLNANLTPLFGMTVAAGRKKRPVTSPRIEWAEDDYVSVWGAVSNGTTDLSSVATGIPVGDISFFATNDLVAVPKAHTSSAAEEIMLVTAVTGQSGVGTLTVTRGIGSAGADTVGATADLRVVAGAYAEGGSVGNARSTTKVVKISYTQIFRETVRITKTGAASELNGPKNDRLFQRKKKLEEVKRQIEQAGLFGRASEDTTNKRRTSMGLKSRITTNIYNASTTLTSSGMESFAELAFNSYFAGTRKVLLAAKKVISAFDYFAQNKLYLQPDVTVFGVKVKMYTTTHGEFAIVRDLLLDNGPGAGIGWGDEAYAVDVDSIEFCPLNGNGENRDLQLLTDVVKNGDDQYVDEYICEGGWVIAQEARHARLYNAQAYA